MSSLFSTEGLFYRASLWLYLFLRLTGLFLLSGLLVVTLPAGLAALFSVIQTALFDRQPPTLLRSAYWTAFRRHFGQSLIIGWSGAVVGLFLLTDLVLVYHLKSPLDTWIFLSILVVGIAYVSSSLYVFALLTRYSWSTKEILATALKLALFKPQLTIFNLVILYLVWVVGGYFPSLLFLFGMPIAVCVTSWIANMKIKALAQAAK